MAVPLYSISQTTLRPSPKLPPYPFPIPSTNGNPRRRSLSLPCTCAEKKRSHRAGADLATELASEVERIRNQRKRKDEAIRKTKGILFSEICEHFGTTEEEMRRRWWKMDVEEKAGFAREFVGEWSVGFHPLSAKSVREMVDEHLGDEEASERSSGSVDLKSRSLTIAANAIEEPISSSRKTNTATNFTPDLHSLLLFHCKRF